MMGWLTSLCWCVVFFHSANTLRIVIGVTSAVLVLAVVLTTVLIVMCVRNGNKTVPTTNDPQLKVAFGTPRRNPRSIAANNIAREEVPENCLPMVSSPPHLPQGSSNVRFENVWTLGWVAVYVTNDQTYVTIAIYVHVSSSKHLFCFVNHYFSVLYK